MTWNYRIMRKGWNDPLSGEPGETFTIHEVYYDEAGKPHTYTVDEISPAGDSQEEFTRSLELYLKAMEKPPLDMDTLEEVEW